MIQVKNFEYSVYCLVCILLGIFYLLRIFHLFWITMISFVFWIKRVLGRYSLCKHFHLISNIDSVWASMKYIQPSHLLQGPLHHPQYPYPQHCQLVTLDLCLPEETQLELSFSRAVFISIHRVLGCCVRDRGQKDVNLIHRSVGVDVAGKPHCCHPLFESTIVDSHSRFSDHLN